MSYPVLADGLEQTSRTLRTRSGDLQGTVLASAAEKLLAALRRFDGVLGNALRGFDPEVKALRTYLEADDVRTALDNRTIKLLATPHRG